jgi:hypothetical protein
MTVRIATFNTENLLSRFDFSGFRNELRQDRVSQLYDFSLRRRSTARPRSRARYR